MKFRCWKNLISIMAELNSFFAIRSDSHPLRLNPIHPNPTHLRNHFCSPTFSLKAFMAVFLRPSMKVNFCAGIFQHHFIFHPLSSTQKRKRKMREKLFGRFFYGDPGWETKREFFHRWWLSDGGMLKMLSEVDEHKHKFYSSDIKNYKN